MRTRNQRNAALATALVLLLHAAPAQVQDRPSPATSAPQESQPDPSDAVAKVRGLVEAARWGEALRTARALAARAPDQPAFRLLVGDTLLLNFRAREAAGEYRSVMESPRYASMALGKLAGALVALGQDADALEVIRDGSSAGVEITEGTRVLQARLEPDPKVRAGILTRLVSGRPEDEALAGLLTLTEALAARTTDPAKPSQAGLGSARVKEIYREPSVMLTINGREEWLALDTGSESILLNGDTIKSLRLPVLAETKYVGWGFRGPRESRYVYVDRLEVAGRTLRGIPAILNRRDSEFWTNKAGYLSLAPFRDALVRYDRLKGIFSLHPSGTDPAAVLGGRPVVLPVLWARDLPLVPVMVQGQGPFPFLLDTGAIYTLLDTKHAEALGIRVNTGKYGKLRAEGMSGSFSSSIAEQVTLGVADVRYDRPVIFVTDVPQRFPVPVFGILGRDILNGYALAIDGPQATAALLRYPN